MPKYQFTGPNPVSIPALGLELKPGDTFETEDKLNHSDIQIVKPDKAKADAKSAKGSTS